MSVLDSSAILAFLNEEEGSEIVAESLAESLLSTVNLAEIVSKLARDGREPSDIASEIGELGVQIMPLDVEDAILTGRLIGATQAHGLSIGDRACLALAIRRNLPAMTADRAWAKVEAGATVILIR